MLRIARLSLVWAFVLGPVCTDQLARAQNAGSFSSPLLGAAGGSPVASLSLSTLNYGNLTVGQGNVVPIVLSNSGTAPLLITSIAIAGAVGGNFTETNSCGLAVAPGGTCNIWVMGAPSVNGAAAASLVVTDNAVGSPQTVALSAVGVGSGSLSVSVMPNIVNFATADVTTRSWPQAITITNTSGANATITGLAFTSGSADFAGASTCGGTLAAGASCTANVVFAPSLPGVRTGVLEIQGSLGNQPVLLTGIGTLVGNFEIVNARSGKALDLAGGATSDGVAVQQNAVNGQTNQQWKFIAVGGGYYAIINAKSGRALDVTALSISNGALIQEWDYLGTANQQWQLAAADDVHVAIVNRASGKVLDVLGGSTGDGTPIQQWSGNGNLQQSWALVPARPYNVTNTFSGKVLDVPAASTSLGAMIEQNASLGMAQQRWQLLPVGGGYYAIQNRFTGKVLDVTGQSTAAGAVIQQWDYVGGQNQQWQLVAQGAVSVAALPGMPSTVLNYEIVNRLSGKALDDTANSTSDGTFIQQYDYFNTANQQWQFTPVMYYYIENVMSGATLDVPGGSLSSGTAIQQWTPLGNPQQQWQFIANANQTYTISNQLSSMALDLSSQTTGNGALIQQATSSGAASQQWDLTLVSGQAYSIKNHSSGKGLDVLGMSVANGAQIQQWDYVGTSNQQWVLVPAGY